MDEATGDESTLIGANQSIHVGCKSSGQDFSEQLSKAMDQTNGSEIPQPSCIILFPEQNYIGLVNQV